MKISFPARKFDFVPEKRHSTPRIKAINAATVGNKLSPLVIFCILNAHQCSQNTTQTSAAKALVHKHLYGTPSSHPTHSSPRREKRYLKKLPGARITTSRLWEEWLHYRHNGLHRVQNVGNMCLSAATFQRLGPLLFPYASGAAFMDGMLAGCWHVYMGTHILS